MVGDALMDDSESKASKTAITIHDEKVSCSRDNEEMIGGSITLFIRKLHTTWGKWLTISPRQFTPGE
jgi:hypothetical protein